MCQDVPNGRRCSIPEWLAAKHRAKKALSLTELHCQPFLGSRSARASSPYSSISGPQTFNFSTFKQHSPVIPQNTKKRPFQNLFSYFFELLVIEGINALYFAFLITLYTTFTTLRVVFACRFVLSASSTSLCGCRLHVATRQH